MVNRIMVVDDEAIITSQLEERLNTVGYDVVGRASSGMEAVEMALNLIPDLILMDIVMPGEIDGIRAVEIINGELDIPVIFLTSYASTEFLEKAKKVEPFGYILKPFDVLSLKASIDIALYKKEKEKQRKNSLSDYRKSIESSLEEKDLLIREINHRVKNNLQTISSLMHLKSRKTNNQIVHEIFDDFVNRINAVSLIHDNLYHSSNLNAIDFAGYIKNLMAELFHVYGVDEQLITLNMEIEKIFLDLKLSVICGLIMIELVTNALKYAFPGPHKEGAIQIDFSRQNENYYFLGVRDDGIGIPGEIDLGSKETLGLQLIQSLVKQIQGTLNVSRDNGTCVKIQWAHRAG